MRISDWSSDVCSSDLDAAGHEGHGLHREVGLDADQGVLVAEDVLREGAELGVAPDRLALAGVGVAAVAHHPDVEELGALVAQVLAAGRAVLAPTAARDERHRDVVAGREGGDPGADGLDDASALVAADDGQAQREVAGDGVLVGVAHPGDGHLDEDVTGLRVRSEEHTSELQSLMRISYAVFCLKKHNALDSMNTTHNL